MEDYASYFAPLADAKAWGVALTGAGFTRVEPRSPYPPGRHPLDHLFTWQRGRVLQAYQLIYILEGRGIFESVITGPRSLVAGTMFMLFPGVWHRYLPDQETGWVESWLELSGPAVERLERMKVFTPQSPIFRVGRRAELERSMEQVHRAAQAREPGCQPVLAMLGLEVLARLQQARTQGVETSEVGGVQEAVRRAQEYLSAQLDRLVTIEEFARQAQMSYSTLRHAFKSMVGMSPKQYHLEMRLRKAKELLQNTALPVGRIAEALGFGSAFHLSACFKRHTGLSPRTWREAHEGPRADNPTVGPRKAGKKERRDGD